MEGYYIITLPRILTCFMTVLTYQASAAHINVTRGTDNAKHKEWHVNGVKINMNYSVVKSTWRMQSFPNPLTEPYRCGRSQPSYICDPSRIISPVDASILDDMIERICQQPSCHCSKNCSTACNGYRLSIAILPRMDFYQDNEEMGPEAVQFEIEAWASFLRTSAWSFTNCGNDIVLVLSVHEHMVYASAGKAAAGHLTSACAESVIQDATVYMKEESYGRALKQMVRDYHSVLQDDFKCVISWNDVMSTGTMIGITFGAVCIPLMLCVLAVFLGPCFRGRGFGGSRHAAAFKKYRYHQPDYDFKDDPPGAATYM